MEKFQQRIQLLLADIGVRLNGEKPWDIQLHHPYVLQRIGREPSLGAGESYVEGWWDCRQLEELFFRITRYLDLKQVYKLSTMTWFVIKHFLINQQSRLRSRQVARQHYDLDNYLYEIMLGETMAYTCGYWQNATTLNQAQYAKYDLICKKLDLQPGEKVLELGCGWGGFAKFAATHYQVAVTAVNISAEQMKFAKQYNKDLPIDLYTTDYRNTHIYNPNHIKFDKIASIGMCEHVGEKNYREFLTIVRNNLKETGLFLLHTIGNDRTTRFADPWIRKYIFPNGMLPSIKQLSTHSEGLFVVEDLHNFGYDYYRTLMAWFDNFDKHWGELKGCYDERFYRLWKYYLLSCAGAFRSRSMQLWQWVLSPKGQLNGYHSLR